jgi:hypothetical protein
VELDLPRERKRPIPDNARVRGDGLIVDGEADACLEGGMGDDTPGHPLPSNLRQDEVRLLTIDTGLDQPYRVHQRLKKADA